MFRGGRGGFGSYTKTGRNIALGRSLGEAMAKGGRSSSSSASSSNSIGNSSGEPPCFATFLLLLICAIILQTITEAFKQKQLQPQ